MGQNPFSITKAEGFNHSYQKLASLMEFKSGVADILLDNTNVFIDGSRGSGKSMYLRLLSHPVKAHYERLAQEGKVESLPDHPAYIGVYVKLAPTVFSPHEYEDRPRFKDFFQQLFNVYCAEHAIVTLLEVVESNVVAVEPQQESRLAQKLKKLVLPPSKKECRSLGQLADLLRGERRRLRQALNNEPYSPDGRSQPELLWEVANEIQGIDQLRGRRIHFLVDEYDSLSPGEQRILNSYLRKRDFPVTFKIACKKHRLTLEDVDCRPLNPSGDFDRVQLDDDDFGLTSTFQLYLERIANRRLEAVNAEMSIRELLSRGAREDKRGVERQFAGFETVTMLSSGIVRTFLELCRDMYARCSARPMPIPATEQDSVIKEHAANKWNVLARDQSARPELQHLVEQVAGLFAAKAKSTESQVIRLEVIDSDRASTFLRSLLEQALEYEAFVQPNRERIQKNKHATSRGYVLHRLLCVHFRLDFRSRWDVEVSSEQLEKLVLGTRDMVAEVIKEPTKRTGAERDNFRSQLGLFDIRQCPILAESCPVVSPQKGLGFLSCRLPEAGHIRDAVRLIRREFSKQSDESMQYEIKTAEDYAPVGDIACKVCHAFAKSDFVLVEMSRLSPSVSMELGLAIARRLPAYILFNTDEQPEVPEPFGSLEYVRYSITPDSIAGMVNDKLIPFLADQSGGRGAVRLGPSDVGFNVGSGVFVALPATDYYQKTIFPEVKKYLEDSGLGPVVSEHDGQALQDLQRAACAIAGARYCLIDTTNGSPTRALYLGMAQGYRRRFANLIDVEQDAQKRVFTNARSKAELPYRDSRDLLQGIGAFLRKFGENL